MLTHSNIFSDLVRDLDAQLNLFGAVAHVTVGVNNIPALVGIGYDLPAPISLDLLWPNEFGHINRAL
jgi:hypothetical protein